MSFDGPEEGEVDFGETSGDGAIEDKVVGWKRPKVKIWWLKQNGMWA